MLYCRFPLSFTVCSCFYLCISLSDNLFRLLIHLSDCQFVYWHLSLFGQLLQWTVCPRFLGNALRVGKDPLDCPKDKHEEKEVRKAVNQ